jgi:hypothetical protein
MCFNLSFNISFQVSKTREQDPRAPRVLKPEVGSGLLQASPSCSRGELWGHHVFVMPHPVCNYDSYNCTSILCMFLYIFILM